MESSFISSSLPTNSTPITPAAPKAPVENRIEVAPQVVVAPQQKGESNLDPKQQEQARYAAVREASEAIIFIVSDHRFTIYKDMDGMYYTRFTSLRDGSVTVMPEKQLLSKLGSSGGNIIATSA